MPSFAPATCHNSSCTIVTLLCSGGLSEVRVLGRVSVCLAGTNKSVQCTVRTDIVDLIPAVLAFKLSFKDEEHRVHTAHLVHDTGEATTVFIDGPHPSTSSLARIWPHSRLVLDKPPYRHDRPEYKDVPQTI